MVINKNIQKELEKLEKTLEKSWNGKAKPQQLEDALDKAIMLIRDQYYAYASISSAAQLRTDEEGPVIRAIVMEDPGMGPQLLLEQKAFGAEDMPISIAKTVEVSQGALNTIGNLRFEGDRLLFTADPDFEPQEYSVKASATELGKKATKVK